MVSPSDSSTDLVTVEEFFRLVPDGQKADLIDGVIYMASPDSRRANDLTGFVFYLLKGFDGSKGVGGGVQVNRYAFELTAYRAPEPDVAYIRPERIGLAGERAMKGGPDIAVEIVSRESRHRDYGEKRGLYEQAGVEEYWIIDPLQQRVEFLVLHEGRYQLAALEENRRFRSRVLPGFWIDVDWLLADPLPNAVSCLSAILAGE